MTIHYSELEDKFWIRDGDDVRWFESSLEAKHALREIEVRQAVDDEVALIVSWLRGKSEVHRSQWAVSIDPNTAALADAIEAKEHLK